MGIFYFVQVPPVVLPAVMLPPIMVALSPVIFLATVGVVIVTGPTIAEMRFKKIKGYLLIK
jgi:hypothetical protein